MVTVTTGSDGGWAVVFPHNQAATQVDVTATLGGVSKTVPMFPVAPGKTFLVPTFRFD